ncbi:hypothetical protein ACWFR1_40250, partial [Streptomyces sp. NPDC055103]
GPRQSSFLLVRGTFCLPDHPSDSPLHESARLKALTGILTLTWPAARSLAGDRELGLILDEDAERRLLYLHELRKRPGKKHFSRALTDPAPDPLAFAACSAIADTILSADSSDAALEMLAPVLRALGQLTEFARALASTLRHARSMSLPLRIILVHEQAATPKLVANYRPPLNGPGLPRISGGKRKA